MREMQSALNLQPGKSTRGTDPPKTNNPIQEIKQRKGFEYKS